MSLRYKVGDRVVLGDAKTLTDINIDEEYAHEIAIIDVIAGNTYWCRVEKDDEKWNIGDEEIDHEATAALNFKVDEAEYGKIVLDLTHAVQDSVCNKTKCSKGGETMNANEILEKWRNKKADELISQQDEEIKKVKKEDEIQKLLEEHEREINKIIKDKYKIDTEVTKIFCTITTRKTGDKIEAINKEFDKKVAELDEKEEEIKAVLKVAENQDKVFEILNKQGIIDKNYNIL